MSKRAGINKNETMQLDNELKSMATGRYSNKNRSQNFASIEAAREADKESAAKLKRAQEEIDRLAAQNADLFKQLEALNLLQAKMLV